MHIRLGQVQTGECAIRKSREEGSSWFERKSGDQERLIEKLFEVLMAGKLCHFAALLTQPYHPPKLVSAR